jgi:16S rRNA (uracil1498-N3)-methyltransferase
VNLFLLEASDFREDGTAELRGLPARHVHEVLRAKAGDMVRVGRPGGDVGSAEVLRCELEAVLLRVVLWGPPPPRPGVDVLLAVPRPKVLRRLLASAAALGVDRLVLLNAARVEKSYFASTVLTPVRVTAALREGLEQARDTHAPEVHVFERFRPFVEDTLDGLLGPGSRLLLDPRPEAHSPEVPRGGRVALAIGPEGGWVPFERELLKAQGFVPVSFGPRTLRVEAVLPYALGWLQGIRTPAPRHGKVSPSVAVP